MTLSLTTQASWYFRGTPNDWQATAMETTDNINFCTQQSFADLSPRFKIDHYADWSENYPSADVTVESNTTYDICFNESSKQITKTVVNGVDNTAPIVTASIAAGTYTSSQQITLSVTDNQDNAPLLYCTVLAMVLHQR